jgi:diaminohydroxyphosphoribosylaminopyrimidine deaminase/5-amino-6-(5-phosphoribosylamino)uracil reductase
MGKRRRLEERGVETLQLKEAAGRISLHAVLRRLAERQITSVLLEAGARLNAHAVETKLVDKLWLFYAPKFYGPDAVPLLAEGALPPLLDYRLHRFGPDFALEGYLRK